MTQENSYQFNNLRAPMGIRFVSYEVVANSYGTRCYSNGNQVCLDDQ